MVLARLQVSTEGEVPHVVLAIKHGDFAKKQLHSLPGDRYGMVFPHTREQLEQMGPAWLTQAFHAVWPHLT